MPKLKLDIENEKLAEEVKHLISKIDYPLRFNNILVSTSYKPEFLSGEAKEDLEIFINPESKILDNMVLFRGFFARFLFLLINKKEGINSDIKEKLELPGLVEFIQNFFADLKATKYGFGKDMHRFFLERILSKQYSKESISKRDFSEFYSYYLILKKTGDESDIKGLIDSIKVVGIELLLPELEKLNYPYALGDENLKRTWIQIFNL